jgi:hypothetical protein
MTRAMLEKLIEFVREVASEESWDGDLDFKGSRSYDIEEELLAMAEAAPTEE